MTICICHPVTDRGVAGAVERRCPGFDDLPFELAIATSRGGCRDHAGETFHCHAAQVQASQPAPDCITHPQRGKVVDTAAQHHHDLVSTVIV